LHAQASVPIPDGLDLDAWIVPPPPEEREIDTTHDLDDTSAEKKIKKSKKGKEKTKERNGTSTKSKKDRNQGDVLAPAEEPAETPEEVAEREKVVNLILSYLYRRFH
jgi:AP-3 complex subunit delta